MTKYYHGGPIGRAPGAFILPPAITGGRSLADYGAAAVCRRDRVYVTSSYTGALLYAAGHKRGVVYEVEPIGELVPDPDCTLSGLSFECEKAKVRRVFKPSIAQIDVARRAMVAP